jgi:hypothetical protein
MKRFWSKVRKRRGNLCWEWLGAKQSAGYGQFFFDGRPTGAHRVSWELEHGPIPNGASVLHICDNPPCVRPSHLYLGDAAQNGSDIRERHRARGNRFTPEQPDHYNLRKTHCPKGHPYSRRTARGGRQCGVCMLESTRRWRERNRAEVRRVDAARRRTPEARAKAAAYQRERRARDPEAYRAYMREWYRKNRAKPVA